MLRRYANAMEAFLINLLFTFFADDHSRVKLIQMDDDITTDYINANYIPVNINADYSFPWCYFFSRVFMND